MAEQPKTNEEMFARYVRGLWKLARMRSAGDECRKYLALQAELNSLNGDDAEYWQNMQTRVEDMALLIRGMFALKTAAQFVDPYGEGWRTDESTDDQRVAFWSALLLALDYMIQGRWTEKEMQHVDDVGGGAKRR